MSREVPDGWGIGNLKSLFSLHTPGFWGQEPDGSCEVKVLRATNLTKDNRLDLSGPALRSFPEKKLDQKSLRFGDIILERSGGSPSQPVGRVGFFEGGSGYSASNFMQIMRADTNISTPTFCYFLMAWLYETGVTEKLQKATTGIRNLDYSTYLQTEIKIPPLHEQRQIAGILSSVDDAIAATRAVIEQTKKVKQGVLERLLTKGIGHTRFKQTEIGEIPESWPLTTADDVCSQISVGIVVKPSQYYTENGIRSFRSANVREGFVQDADWVYITEEGNRVNRKSILRTGDVLVVRTGYPGTSCVVTPEYDGANCIDIIFARPDNGQIDSTFLSTFINSESGKTQVLKAEGGLAQKHFNVGAMKQMKIPLPSIAEQRQIVSQVAEFSKNEALQGEILQQHIQTKSALMSDLLTGRRRVTEALPMAAE